ncbi:ATP-grasp domain-containing protein [Microseira sp. BLCC-F43]|jgi:succinyl-CoA synthetase beta subunit|uniref:ATP-grasp domain-containing protein n=1 Tax=Microseira sp. BLCC-F43 TaxID=3153602 RepID=UPI0035B96C14
MDLLEYQAKELFREIGIPVLPSQRIDRPSDLKDLKIPYPVVLKSQVPKGNRGRAGGIKFVENTIDAIAAAQTIFQLPIRGEYPKVLLAEARYNATQEFYLAVALDYTLCRPVLLGSPQGGMDSDAVQEKMQQVIVEGEFSPFYARRLALKMGLQGQLISAVSTIVEAMYKLFIQKDLDLVEINPLGVSLAGEVMALDGKVIANDAALGRHRELVILAKQREKEKGDERDLAKDLSMCYNSRPQVLEAGGNIAVVCNGNGLGMVTLDLVYQGGGKPASYLNIGEEMTGMGTGTTLCDRLERGLGLLSENRGIKVVLVNILGGATSCDGVAGIIAKYLPPSGETVPAVNSTSGSRRRSGVSVTQEVAAGVEVRSQTHYPHFVVRLAGSYLLAARERLAGLGVSVVDKLDEAVSKAVSLAK